jgi:uncharacterized cupin superfamily protein
VIGVYVLSACDVQMPASELKPTSTTGQREATLPVAGLKTAHAGVWECDAGTFTADRAEMAEVCTIVSGRAVIATEGTSDRRDIGPGSLVVLPRGWRGTWVVTEQIRKTYVMLSDELVQPGSEA